MEKKRRILELLSHMEICNNTLLDEINCTDLIMYYVSGGGVLHQQTQTNRLVCALNLEPVSKLRVFFSINHHSP